MGNKCCNQSLPHSPRLTIQNLPKVRRKIKIFQRQCQICCCLMQKQVIISCGHAFHQQCLQEYYQTLIKNNEIKLSCPNLCGKELDYQEIKKFTTKILFQQYERNVLNITICANIQFHFCPTAQCTGVFEIASDDIQCIECTVCHKEFCVICKKASHGELDCDIGDQMINNQAITKAGFKKCPHCGATVERIKGCNAVQCKCGNQFCYDCGGTSCPHGECSNNKEEDQ